MPETLQIAAGTFIRLSIASASVYGVYRVIAYGLSRMPERAPKERTWEGVQLLYTVPTGIFGFIVAVFLVAILAGVAALKATARWLDVPGEIGDMLFLLSCAGILTSFVIGLYQDHPPARLKILGVIAGFSALAGIASG